MDDPRYDAREDTVGDFIAIFHAFNSNCCAS
jgi:hypothetical protein